MNEQNRHCYLHIGAPKTGTSAIQQYCVSQHRHLIGAGFYYPLANIRGWGHHDIAFLLAGGYPDWAVPQEKTLPELTGQLAEEIGPRTENVLFSSENFYLLTHPEPVRQWLRDVVPDPSISHRVVVYIRRQDDAHESWYNQTIKAQGYTHSLEECVAEFTWLWDYRAVLQPWIDVFGRENIIVRRHSRDEPVTRDFLRTIGARTDQDLDSKQPANPSLSRELVEFQRLVNRLPLPIVKKRSLHRSLMDLSAATRDSSLFSHGTMLPETSRREIVQRYQESNDWLGETFFDGRPPFPATTTEPCRTSSRVSASKGLTTEKLAMILGWVLCQDETNPKELAR